jgi:hypothetical protein
MSVRAYWENTALVHHYHAVKAAPRETLTNRWLILTAMLFATGGMPLSELLGLWRA